MPRTADRIEFAPPRDKGSLRAFGLALLVHILLIAALTWGVNWKRSDETASFEAELWSGMPEQTAPKELAAPPPEPAAPPIPAPEPRPAPPPPPVPKAPEVKVTPPLPDVDIALEKEKNRKLLQQQKEAEVRKAQKLQEKREAELQARKEKELAQRKAQELTQKAEAKKQDARERAKEEEKEKRTAAANAAAAAEKQRQAAIEQRIMKMAGAGSSAAGPGTAKAGGPSATYAGKVRAKVLPNVVFADEISGNPKAEVEVSTTSDGTIMSQRLTKSSGNKAWDDAVMKAIVRTGSLPRDVDGRVPTPMIIEFRPH